MAINTLIKHSIECCLCNSMLLLVHVQLCLKPAFFKEHQLYPDIPRLCHLLCVYISVRNKQKTGMLSISRPHQHSITDGFNVKVLSQTAASLDHILADFRVQLGRLTDKYCALETRGRCMSFELVFAVQQLRTTIL